MGCRRLRSAGPWRGSRIARPRTASRCSPARHARQQNYYLGSGQTGPAGTPAADHHAPPRPAAATALGLSPAVPARREATCRTCSARPSRALRPAARGPTRPCRPCPTQPRGQQPRRSDVGRALACPGRQTIGNSRSRMSRIDNEMPTQPGPVPRHFTGTAQRWQRWQRGQRGLRYAVRVCRCDTHPRKIA